MDRLPFDEWLPQAQRLSFGKSARVNHVCGDDRTMRINHTAKGYDAYCHRCGLAGFKPHGQQSLSQYIERWKHEAKAYEQPFTDLPDGLVHPANNPRAVLWLGRGNITNAHIERFGFRYHPDGGRCILPVRDWGDSGTTGRVVYYQARAVHPGQSPKYLNPSADKTRIWFNSAAYSREGPAPTVVVTEDILSAARVGSVRQIDGASLLGTKASPWHLVQLGRYQQVYIWLDPDEAGYSGERRLQSQLALMGIRAVALRSSQDPKCYPHRVLEEVLLERKHYGSSDSEGSRIILSI